MKVNLVGAGPGDPGLITVRGREAIAAADVVVYDALANRALLDAARPDAELIYVGKVADQHALPQDQINELLAAKASEGKYVVRLKGGDPYVFGRGGEEAEYLASRGVPFEETPGVSSAVAAPACAGIPLTHRDFASSVTILTGHAKYRPDGSAHNWEALAKSRSTLVVLMGMKNLPEIARSLVQGGLAEDTPAAVIYKGATPEQKSVFAPLGKIAEAAAAAGLANPAVVVIGKVASLGRSLDWFTKRPLFGKTIAVTRARAQASELTSRLEALGARVIECPAIKIAPLEDYSAADAAIADILSYRWIIFTSSNGVKYFWERLRKAGLDTRALSAAKIAAIGPGTAEALRGKGVTADFIPTSFVAEEAANQLVGQEGAALAGQRALIPRAAKARMVLPDELAAADMKVDAVPVYQTVPGEGCGKEIEALLEAKRLDCVAFASSSTVVNFLKIIPAGALKAHPEVALAAIGPVTAATLQANGLGAAIQPSSYAIPGLAEAIAKYYESPGKDKAQKEPGSPSWLTE